MVRRGKPARKRENLAKTKDTNDVIPNACTLPIRRPTRDFNIITLNARSLSSKLADLSDQFKIREADVALVSETWEKDSTAAAIEEFQETRGVKWMSKRRTNSGGGGVAVIVNNDFGKCKVLDVNDDNLEVIWVLIRPHFNPKLALIVCSIYASPTAGVAPPPRNALQEHLADNIEELGERFPGALFCCGGDFNHLPYVDVLAIPNMSQLMDKPTRGDAYLEKLLSNLDFMGCDVLPPLAVALGLRGKNSDHKIAFVALQLPVQKKRSWLYVTRRQYSEARAVAFADEMTSLDWDSYGNLQGSELLANVLDDALHFLYNKHFPLVTTRVKEGEPLYFNNSLRKFLGRIKRLFYRTGYTPLYEKLRQEFRLSLRQAKEAFYNGKLSASRRQDIKAWHADISRMMRSSGVRAPQVVPALPELRGLDEQGQAEKVADTIEEITVGHSIADDKWICENLDDGDFDPLEVDEVVAAIADLKVPAGLHERDPPRLLIKRYPLAFAGPLTTLFNEILRTKTWPLIWKEEQTKFIEKNSPVSKMDDLRPIAITNLFSKLLESIVRVWLLDDIRPNLDLQQYGGLSGLSCDHYLVQTYQDLLDAAEQGYVAVVITFDLSKAFNTTCHQSVLKAAKGLGARPALQRLLASYLRNNLSM